MKKILNFFLGLFFAQGVLGQDDSLLQNNQGMWATASQSSPVSNSSGTNTETVGTDQCENLSCLRRT